MGIILSFECRNPECDFKDYCNIGPILRTPKIEKQVKAKIRAGEYGELAKKFLTKYSNAWVNVFSTGMQCKRCHKIKTVNDMTIIVPSKEGDPYQLQLQYDHHCSCGGRLRRGSGVSPFRCPKCGGELNISTAGLSD